MAAMSCSGVICLLLVLALGSGSSLAWNDNDLSKEFADLNDLEAWTLDQQAKIYSNMDNQVNDLVSYRPQRSVPCWL